MNKQISHWFVLDVKETAEFLQTLTPRKLLQPSTALERAETDHANDTELHNLIGHEGSDGSTTESRICRYTNWDVRIGENIRYGSSSAREIVVTWLIDDGAPGHTRPHRRNVLDPGNFTLFIVIFNSCL